MPGPGRHGGGPGGPGGPGGFGGGPMGGPGGFGRGHMGMPGGPPPPRRHRGWGFGGPRYRSGCLGWCLAAFGSICGVVLLLVAIIGAIF